jgi:predicted Zn finger-like uncharacterized protein
MSFTTRCPACGTTFRIVPDQLKISDGWVRCGHCADVFDATLFLEGEVAPVVPAAPAVTPVNPSMPETPVAGAVSDTASAPVPPEVIIAPEPMPAPAPEQEVEDSDGDWLLHPTPSLPVQAPVGADLVRVPGPAPKPASVDDAFVDELRRFAQASPLDKPERHPAVESPPGPLIVHGEKAAPADFADPVTTADGYDLPVSPEVLPEAPNDEPLLPVEPGFVRQARRRAFWRSRGVRVAMVVVSLLLGLVLLAQVAVHERDSLAARFPAATPLLTALCLPTDCQIGPVRQIESVVIDSSNLVRRLGSFYSFDFVLKNSARTPVAVPALELSLTDTREAVIARRVFLPDELPGAPQLLPAQGSLSLSLRLSIAEQGVSSMSGYRALVFYP